MTTKAAQDELLLTKPVLQKLHIEIKPTRGCGRLALYELWEYRELLWFLTTRDIKANYRQMALGQTIHDFEDIAIILVVNSLFLVSALLYFGAIPLRTIKIKTVLFLYVLMVVLGAVFVFLKYSVFGNSDLSTAQLFNKVLIVGAVTGIIVLFWVILSLLGKRRMDKELEE